MVKTRRLFAYETSEKLTLDHVEPTNTDTDAPATTDDAAAPAAAAEEAGTSVDKVTDGGRWFLDASGTCYGY